MMETNRTMTDGFLYAVCLNCVCVALLFLLHEQQDKISTVKNQTQLHHAPLKIRWVKTAPPQTLSITPPNQEKKVATVSTPQAMPTETQKPLPQSNQLTGRVVKKRSARTPRRRRQAATRPLSLQDIANGFLNKASASAIKDRLKTKGHITGRQSAEQIQFHRYFEKTSSALNASFRSMLDKKPFIGKRNSQTIIEVLFKADGTIAATKILESSGIPGLDSFILQLFEETNNSFPPIPTCLKCNLFPVRYTINLDETTKTLAAQFIGF